MENSTLDVEMVASTVDMTVSQQDPLPTVDGRREGEEVDGDDSEQIEETQKTRRSRPRTAACWTWFMLIEPKEKEGKPKARCKKCFREFMADPRSNGTTSLNNHMRKCPKSENKDIIRC